MTCRIFSFSVLALGLVACSPSITTDRTEIAATDSSAYNLGREHAVYLMDSCLTDKEKSRMLLEMHCMQGSIEEHYGEDAATAYQEGIRTQLIERNDTLANVF